MSTNDHVGELATAFNKLIVVPSADVDARERAVVAGHSAGVAAGLAELHRLLFPAARVDPSQKSVAALSTDPLGVLGALLDAHRRVNHCPLGPAERLAGSPSTTTAAAWRDAERHATLAVDEASRLHPSWAEKPAVAWQAVADLADLSEAFAIADYRLGYGALATSGERQGEGDLHAALRLAAAQSGALARSGALEPATIPALTQGAQPSLRPVREASALADAQRRVAAMLDRGNPCIAPEMLTRVLTRQAQAHLAAADLIVHGGRRDGMNEGHVNSVAEALTLRSRYFVLVARTLGGVRGLYRGGERPVRQTAEILDAIRTASSGAPRPDAAPLTACIIDWGLAGEHVVNAVARHTTRAMTNDEWCVGNPRTSGSTSSAAWVPASRRMREPAVVAATQRMVADERDIAAHLRAVARSLALTPVRSAASIAARAALRETLNAYATIRPAHPAHRIQHVTLGGPPDNQRGAAALKSMR